MMTQEGCYLPGYPYMGRYNLDFNIKKEDKVLDIGSGPRPFLFSTHCIDKLSNYTYGQKTTQPLGKIFYDAFFLDISEQFRDKEFDFIYSSHTLEHIENLPEAINEINRIGKRGFIAVPGYFSDFLTNGPENNHQWFLDYQNNTLLGRKRLPTDYSIFSKYWSDIMWDPKNVEYMMLWESDKNIGIRWLWEIRFFWTEKIEFKIDETIFPQLKIFRELQKKDAR